jgi:hypothetical protein
MGLFNRSPKAPAAPADLFLIDDTIDDYVWDIVGESRCDDHLRSCIRNASQEARDLCEIEGLAQLVPEPTNDFDPNAIQVWMSEGRVGYIGKNDTRHFHPFLAAAKQQGASRVWVLSRIGWNDDYSNPLIGVRLRLGDDPVSWRVLSRDALAAEAEAQG